MHLIARRSITNRNNKYSKFSYCKNIKHVLYPLTGQSLKLKNWILCPSYTTTQISCEYFSLTHVDSKLWQTLCSVFQCFGQWHAWISDNFSVTLFLYWSSWQEIITMIIFILMAILWFTRNPGFMPGWSSLFPEWVYSHLSTSFNVDILLHFRESHHSIQ